MISFRSDRTKGQSLPQKLLQVRLADVAPRDGGVNLPRERRARLLGTVARVGEVARGSEVERERLAQGRAAFNRGAYFLAHELWEDAWRALEGSDRLDERLFMQGLIQLAAGLHHLQEQRPGPAATLLRKGLDKLSRGAGALPVALDLTGLTRDVARLLTELASGATPPVPPLAL